jgi:NAD(P)-dependent dehydrogenase (short-subunit alcohol dehydrogenase family)
MICKLDLSKPEASETLIAATLDRFGRIDALLNIAGAATQMPLTTHEAVRLRDTLQPTSKRARVQATRFFVSPLFVYNSYRLCAHSDRDGDFFPLSGFENPSLECACASSVENL